MNSVFVEVKHRPRENHFVVGGILIGSLIEFAIYLPWLNKFIPVVDKNGNTKSTFDRAEKKLN